MDKKKIHCQAKILYYQNQFPRFKSDMWNTWSTINEILNKNKVKQLFPSYFIHKGRRLENPQIIADEFYKFFTDVGPTLAIKIDFPQNICY